MLAVMLLAGCASADIEQRDPVPARFANQAYPVGLKDVRAWGDEPLPMMSMMMDGDAGKKLHDVLMERKGNTKKFVVANMLALSGGGEDGAFGAGLLVGWGERGDRPEFDIVTGISAGALLAPFALLGREFDGRLAAIFTAHGSDMLYEKNVVGALFGASAVADTAPLRKLMEKYVDRKLMTRLAEERSKGRLVIIGTTNIDAQRPVHWDLGKIAQVGTDEALELMRSVLLASAAIPGLFTPVKIPVKANGRTFEEVHVDGGTSSGIFFTLSGVNLKEIDKCVGMKVHRRLFAVMNGKIGAERKTVKLTALDLSKQAIEVLLKSQASGDLARIHAQTVTQGIEFNLAAIPADFVGPPHEPFDPAYTKVLYERGRQLGRNGDPWQKAPPVATASTSN